MSNITVDWRTSDRVFGMLSNCVWTNPMRMLLWHLGKHCSLELQPVLAIPSEVSRLAFLLTMEGLLGWK